MMDVTGLTPTMVLGMVCSGIFSLLYGVHLATDVMAGPRFRRSLVVLSQQPFAAFGVGMLVTMVTQSSGATSSLLVTLVSARVLTLAAAIISMLGANIGSALAVQLLSFHITRFALILIGVGAATALFTRKTSLTEFGLLCFSFSLMVFGLAALEVGGNSLANNPTTALVLSALSSSPLILALSGAVLTIIFSSSVAGIGLVIVLTSHGLLTLDTALALMLGANVGSTITALFTALFGNSPAGRRLALLHTGTKLVLATGLFGILHLVAQALFRLPLPAAELVALAHLGFNLALALIFVPCIGLLASLAERLLPDKPEEEANGPLYLHPEDLQTPAEALGQATREVLHMTDLVTAMLNLSILAFEEKGKAILARLARLDDQLDQLNTDIKYYLTQLDEAAMTEDQKNTQIALLYITTDLEAMGDLLETQCVRLAERKNRRQLIFSDTEWQEIRWYHQEIRVAVQQAFAAVATQDPDISNAFFTRKKLLDQKKQELHLHHMRRLQSGSPLSAAASSLYLDLLTTFRNLLTHASTIAHVVQEYLAIDRAVTSEQESPVLFRPTPRTTPLKGIPRLTRYPK